MSASSSLLLLLLLLLRSDEKERSCGIKNACDSSPLSHGYKRDETEGSVSGKETATWRGNDPPPGDPAVGGSIEADTFVGSDKAVTAATFVDDFDDDDEVGGKSPRSSVSARFSKWLACRWR